MSLLILALILILLLGLGMIISPQTVWKLKESWKSNDATEPSDLYLWSTRFGGAVFLLVGVSCLVIFMLY